MWLHLNRVRLGVVSLKERNGVLGRVKLVRYWHLLVLKYSKSAKSLIRMGCMELVFEMFKTSLDFPLHSSSGSRIVGGVSSQFTGSTPHNRCEILVNGKADNTEFSTIKGRTIWVCSLYPFSWVKRQEVCEKKENKQSDISHPKNSPDSLAKTSFTIHKQESVILSSSFAI